MIHSGPLPARRAGLLGRFRKDGRGVAAIEFAFIAPVMIILYFGVAELCTVMMADRRSAHADSAIGDLAAQTDKLADADVTNVFAVASTILSPFDIAPLQLRLTSVTLNSAGQPKVEWSDVKSASQADLPQLACNQAVTNFPANLVSAPGDNVVMAEAVYAYDSPISYLIKSKFKFKPRYFMRPRQSAKVVRMKPDGTAVACTIT